MGFEGKEKEREREIKEGKISLPAVTNHAEALGLGHAVELGALLQVLLAAEAVVVAVARFSQRVDITPC
jgi:hypothetical protein